MPKTGIFFVYSDTVKNRTNWSSFGPLKIPMYLSIQNPDPHYSYILLLAILMQKKHILDNKRLNLKRGGGREIGEQWKGEGEILAQK